MEIKFEGGPLDGQTDQVSESCGSLVLPEFKKIEHLVKDLEIPDELRLVTYYRQGDTNVFKLGDISPVQSNAGLSNPAPWGE